jgi:aldehyde:ferredoxin oxidoreductase
VLVEDEHVSIRDARHLWGKDAIESEEMLLAEHNQKGKKGAVAVIGQAGEGLIPDLRHL